ncbi:hypothetical protein GCM10023149_31460 [Mucilaginibacter gynuensis]|uniref:OmpA-like domain-containing protein n=1 Tax=Mucilaginibacter gynuensis TaxID=1302236 RepID=A0ABP8GPT9_9SPHI
MKLLRSLTIPFVIIFAIAVLPACKAKKVVQKPTPPPPAKPAPAPAQAPKAEPPVEKVTPPPPPAKPDYNFSNIQFEFNSGILKTASFPILDKAATEMKKDPSVKFVLDGHSSAEGTPEHNLSLSIERANAVKTYLANTGVNAANLSIKGYGESKPIADNKTEEGRVLNRRVEIKKQ